MSALGASHQLTKPHERQIRGSVIHPDAFPAQIFQGIFDLVGQRTDVRLLIMHWNDHGEIEGRGVPHVEASLLLRSGFLNPDSVGSTPPFHKSLLAPQSGLGHMSLTWQRYPWKI
jgi:hypothetical protein